MLVAGSIGIITEENLWDAIQTTCKNVNSKDIEGMSHKFTVIPKTCLTNSLYKRVIHIGM